MIDAITTRLFILAFSVFALWSNSSYAEDFYWINGSGNWTDNNHWSLNSGGSPSGGKPTAFDNVIFDELSTIDEESIIYINGNPKIHDITYSSQKLIKFHGDSDLTIKGNLSFETKKVHFSLDGKLIFENTTADYHEINPNSISFFNDISFVKGKWDLKGHLKTSSENSIYFNDGTFRSNGFTVHTKNLIVNNSRYSFDFTDSHISVISTFDLSKAKNIGGNAIYVVDSPNLDRNKFNNFSRSGDIEKDNTAICGSLVLELTITSDYNGENVSCFEVCDAEISVTASGTPGPFSYRLGSSGTFGPDNTFSSLCVGTPTVSVTDSSNLLAPPNIYAVCSVSDNITGPAEIIFLPDPPPTIAPTCPGVCDGKAFVTVSGGVPPLTIEWENSETSFFPTMLCEGDNPLSLIDANGCQKIDTVNIVAPPIIIADPTITEPICNGDDNATITLNPSNGTGTYSFNWTPAPTSGATSNPGVGFSAGPVDLTITDVGNGCSMDTTIIITDPPVLIIAIDGIVELDCDNICIGEANAVVTGGVASYNYLWFNSITGLDIGITDQTATGLCAGTYFVRVTDASGCIVDSDPVIISEPDPIVLNVDAYSVNCFGECTGSVDVDAIGGTGLYDYDWTEFPGASIGVTDSISNLCPGEYQIIVTDANGCVTPPQVVEIMEPLEVLLSIVGNNPSCYDLCDGTATATVTNGVAPITYNWIPSPATGSASPTPSDMCAGVYTLNITDDNGCMQTDMVELISPPPYDIEVDSITPLCFGDLNGSIDIILNSGGSGIGYTYDWSPVPPSGAGTPNVSGLGAGTWNVTIGDSENCDTTLSIVLVSPPAMTLTTGVIAGSTCNGDCDGSASVSILGGTPTYTILWNDPMGQTTPVATGLCAGMYTVTVTDANGCIETETVEIIEPTEFTITTDVVNPSCFEICDGTATINVLSGATGPYTILWDAAAMSQTTFTATGLCVGTYNATVFDANLCDTIITVNITEPFEIILTTGTPTPTCFGECTGTASFTFTGGVGVTTIEWFDSSDTPLLNNSTSISGLCPGDYYATVTDANGCMGRSIDITIVELPEIELALVSSTDATCAVCDGTAEISATGGAGGFNYDWDPNPGIGDGTAIASDMCSGSYIVTVTDANACEQTITVNIDDLALEVIALDQTNILCFGECTGVLSAVFVPIDGPYTLEWIDNITGISTGLFGSPATGLCAGQYRAQLTNGSGCVKTDTISISEPTQITSTISPTAITCNALNNGMADAIGTAGGVGDYVFTWGLLTPGGGQGTPNATGLTPGPWQVIINDANGCTETFTTTITEPDAMVIESETSTDVTCFGDINGTASVTISGGSGTYSYEWIDCATNLAIGQTTATATGLSIGSYECEITDGNGCIITSTCLPISSATEITVTENVEVINCFGDCNGLISIVATGGTGTYTYQWLNEAGTPLVGQTNDSLENLCVGIYSIRITDDNGCIQEFGPYDVTSPTEGWDIVSSQTGISCDGECDGTASVVVLAGQTPGYTYQWDDGMMQTTPTANLLCEGLWNVTITDASGVCDTTLSFTIIDEDPISINPTSIVNNNCFGDCNGSIDIAPTGGAGTYTLNWDDGQTGTSVTGLCAGPITLSLTDASGCTKDTVFIITESPELLATSSSTDPTECGICNATATVNVTGGIGDYTYNWTPDPGAGDDSNIATGLCPGVSTVVVTDELGCTLTEVFTISDITAEVVTTASTDATCFELCDGTAEATFTCSDVPCTQEWFDNTGTSTGITTTTIDNLCAGEYYIQVENATGCITVETVTIGSPPSIIPNEIITPLLCTDGSNASIVLTPTGGSGSGYTYLWAPVPPNGDDTNEALDLDEGTWGVTITDGDDCQQIFSFDISNPSPINIDLDSSNITCFSFCNGFITTSVTGGAGGYTFQWFMDGAMMTGETASSVGALCPGNYNLEIRDANNCLVTLPEDILITQPDQIVAVAESENISCFGLCDGIVNISIVGGVEPYIINWFDATTGTAIGVTDTFATGLCAGQYYATISDANACVLFTDTLTVVEPPELTFAFSVVDAGCFGFCDGTGDLILTGGTPGYSYEWLTDEGDAIPGGTGPNVSNLCSGDYSVIAQDTNACSTGIISFAIGQFPEISGSVTSNDATCAIADGNATIFASGGATPFSYQWFDISMDPLVGETNMVLNDVFSGIYFVEVTDGNGCTEIFMSTIGDTDGPTVVFDAINNPTCFGEADGSFEITATGIDMPFTYIWNPDGLVAEDPTGLTAGDYLLQVTNAIGCVTYENASLIDPTEIQAIANITATSCNACNGSIDLTLSGGTGDLSILWSTGSTDTEITDLCGGIYEAQITDANGCSVIRSFLVGNSEGFAGNIAVDPSSCSGACGGIAIVTASGGTSPYTYEWLHDGSTSPTLGGLCEGNYYVEITDSLGCMTTAEAAVVNPPAIEGESILINPTCGASNGIISVMTSGGVLPHSYSWNTSDTTPTITDLSAGIYVLTITDATGCSTVLTYELNNIGAAVIEFVTNDISCFGLCDGNIDTLNLVSDVPALTYEWFNSNGSSTGITSPRIENLCAGEYFLQVTDISGCTSIQSAAIKEPNSILLNSNFTNNPLCNNSCDGSIFSSAFGGTLPLTYSWNDPDSQSSNIATGLCEGNYELTVTDANGCFVSQTGTLIDPTIVTATIDSTQIATCQDSNDGGIFITASGGTPGYTYQWISQAEDTLNIEDPNALLPMNYYLTVTDANGCIFMDTASVDTLIIIDANAGPDSLICNLTDYMLIGSSNYEAATYTWYDTLGTELSDSIVLSIPGQEAGVVHYVLEVMFSGCTDYDTIVVTTNGVVAVDAGPDIEMYSPQTRVIGGSPTTDPTNTVEWSPTIYLDDSLLNNPSVIKPEEPLWYYVTATDTNGCQSVDSVYITLLQAIEIPNGISPGSDGKNDTWILDIIDVYPDVEFKINVYNRWGDVLFTSDQNYQDDWGGTTQDGKRLPAGTYYYVIEIDHPDFPEPATGPLTIMW